MLENLKPRISTEYFSIASGARLAPTYDETGLPIHARKRGCLQDIGDECPYKMKGLFCDPDNIHHGSYNGTLYRQLGGFQLALRENPLNMFEMAACRHHSNYRHAIHNMFDLVPPPPDEIAYEYDFESRLFIRMEMIIGELESQLRPYMSSKINNPSQYRARELDAIAGKANRLGKLMFVYDKCSRQVDSISVIPEAVIGRKLSDLRSRRNAIKSRSVSLPEPIAEKLVA